MADKNTLLALIANELPDNNNNEITPADVRAVLSAMVNSDLNLDELTDQFIQGAIVGVLLKTAATPQPNPAWSEGLVFWDDTEKSLSYYNDNSDVNVNCGQEVLIRVFNDTGETIFNGESVRFAGSNGVLPTVTKSLADNLNNSSSSGIATHDIENNSVGYITRTGKIGGVDTSSFSAGETLYVSDSVPGALTNVPPGIANPIAVVLTSAVNGSIFTATSRLKTPVAIGQERASATPVTQDITATPAPVSGFSDNPFTVNTVINNIPSGNGFRAQFSPSSSAFSGFYRAACTLSVTTSSNVKVFFEIYLNGTPTGISSVIDLTNNNTTSGSASLNSISETQITESDVIELYVYTDTATATITWNSLSFSIERSGLE